MKYIKVPKHVAIIMDGNGRWATKRGLPRTSGHLEGSKTLEKVSKYILDSGVEVLSVFAFSTDNFKRDQSEVDYLMNLFVKMFTSKLNVFMKNNIKVIFSGMKEPLPEKVMVAMENITNETAHNTNGILNICLNYGGQEEIVDATKKLVMEVISGKIKIDDVNKEMFKKYMYQDLPPIDLLIRTSGEYRISNFMIYESAYSEYYFTDTLFPDFDNKEFDKALEAYNNRDRRFGGMQNETKNN